jgi:hypothetical protein
MHIDKHEVHVKINDWSSLSLLWSSMFLLFKMHIIKSTCALILPHWIVKPSEVNSMLRFVWTLNHYLQGSIYPLITILTFSWWFCMSFSFANVYASKRHSPNFWTIKKIALHMLLVYYRRWFNFLQSDFQFLGKTMPMHKGLMQVACDQTCAKEDFSCPHF